jgi:hypothetical protein
MDSYILIAATPLKTSGMQAKAAPTCFIPPVGSYYVFLFKYPVSNPDKPASKIEDSIIRLLPYALCPKPSVQYPVANTQYPIFIPAAASPVVAEKPSLWPEAPLPARSE